MRIGQLALRAGLAPSAIRYYESIGILKPPARVSGRREYANSALDTLQFVQAAQRAGFTLAETRELVGLLRSGGPDPWPSIARRKLVELDASIAKLTMARRLLASAMNCACEGKIDACALVADR
ncbi:MerR family transcriptional regulator [Pendulispora albinea]|uniref:MerR family transcriptional regulator n=1 Tax=Pendulispora albinea TaxID=2741071 RepID=A0ABZ2LTY2_9BACT